MPDLAPAEVQASWEEAAEDDVAVAGNSSASTASAAQWPLPGGDLSCVEAQHSVASNMKADAAEAWAAAGAEDDAQAAQDDEEFDANMLWCNSETVVSTASKAMGGCACRTCNPATAVACVVLRTDAFLRSEVCRGDTRRGVQG